MDEKHVPAPVVVSTPVVAAPMEEEPKRKKSKKAGEPASPVIAPTAARTNGVPAVQTQTPTPAAFQTPFEFSVEPQQSQAPPQPVSYHCTCI